MQRVDEKIPPSEVGGWFIGILCSGFWTCPVPTCLTQFFFFFDWKQSPSQNMYPDHMPFTEKSCPLKWCLRKYWDIPILKYILICEKKIYFIPREALHAKQMQKWWTLPFTLPSTSMWAARVCPVHQEQCSGWAGEALSIYLQNDWRDDLTMSLRSLV